MRNKVWLDQKTFLCLWSDSIEIKNTFADT